MDQFTLTGFSGAASSRLRLTHESGHVGWRILEIMAEAKASEEHVGGKDQNLAQSKKRTQEKT